MYVKSYKMGRNVLVAACDRDLLGRCLREKELKLDVTENFYKGSLASCKELADMLKDATIANLVGERTVKCAVSRGFIDRENVIKICGVPHAQMFVV
jgi:hypothetical protein